MTNNPACCTPQMNLQQVARMMTQYNCGAIPVVEDEQTNQLVGIITDRDIACRAVADGQNPFSATVADCMSNPVYTVTPDMSVEDCIRMMEAYHVRRIPVSDGGGCCCGIVAQADIARRAPEQKAGILVKEISQAGPSGMM
jgi:CBS domain-containing protein